MGIERNLYVGWYIKVWMPMKTVEAWYKECPKCEARGGDLFCSKCGSEMREVTIERPKDFGGYLDNIFGDEDMFYGYTNPYSTIEDNIVFVMPNKKHMNYGVSIDDYDDSGEVDADIREPVSHNPDDKEWFELLEHLRSDGIEHEVKQGILNYYT